MGGGGAGSHSRPHATRRGVNVSTKHPQQSPAVHVSAFTFPPMTAWRYTFEPQSTYIYLEYHGVCSLVRIGTPPHPISRKRVSSPPPDRNQRGKGHTLLRVRGWESQFGLLEKKPTTLSTSYVFFEPFLEGRVDTGHRHGGMLPQYPKFCKKSILFTLFVHNKRIMSRDECLKACKI
jgi:hypothetical protein